MRVGRRSGRRLRRDVCLVAAHGWDVMGAMQAGLRGVWWPTPSAGWSPRFRPRRRLRRGLRRGSAHGRDGVGAPSRLESPVGGHPYFSHLVPLGHRRWWACRIARKAATAPAGTRRPTSARATQHDGWQKPGEIEGTSRTAASVLPIRFQRSLASTVPSHWTGAGRRTDPRSRRESRRCWDSRVRGGGGQGYVSLHA
jgi:hypothetical protein